MRANAVKPRSLANRDEHLTGLVFILPAAVCWILFFLVPFAQAFYISFFDYNFAVPDRSKFLGLQNYINLFQDKNFISFNRGALWNTLSFVVVVVPLLTALSLGLAYAVNQKFRGRGLFRTVYYLPYIIAPIAVATVFMNLFVKNGMASRLFVVFGFPNVTWNANVNLAMPMIGIMFIWQLVGFYMVYYLSGLQNIPVSVYEAADIDGTNGWQKFRFIVLPMLKPTTFLVITYATIQAFQLFDQIAAVNTGTNLGSPAGATSTMLTYFYMNSFRYYKMGYGSAIAITLFVLILIVTIIQKKLTGNTDD